jgi:adenylate cyclase
MNMSEQLQQLIDLHFATLELDLVMVKGKTEPERMFALMGDAAMAQSAAYRDLVDRQAEFLRLYRSGAFAEALELTTA